MTMWTSQLVLPWKALVEAHQMTTMKTVMGRMQMDGFLRECADRALW